MKDTQKKKIAQNYHLLSRVETWNCYRVTACPRHRNGLGKYWRSSKLFQYPGHKGTATSVKSRDVINPAIAKEVFQLFGICVPVGSCKYKTHNIWKISLSKSAFHLIVHLL